MRGTVTKMKATYGFIAGEDGVPRFFIPSSMAQIGMFDELHEGDAVEFTHVDHTKGARAILVRAVETSPVVFEEDQP